MSDLTDDELVENFRQLPVATQLTTLWHGQRDIRRDKQSEHHVLRVGLFAVVALCIGFGILIAYIWYRTILSDHRASTTYKEQHDFACAVIGLIPPHQHHRIPDRDQPFLLVLHKQCPELRVPGLRLSHQGSSQPNKGQGASVQP